MLYAADTLAVQQMSTAMRLRQRLYTMAGAYTMRHVHVSPCRRSLQIAPASDAFLTIPFAPAVARCRDAACHFFIAAISRMDAAMASPLLIPMPSFGELFFFFQRWFF